MSVLSILFKPSGKKFYDLFDQVGANVSLAAGLLRGILNAPDAAQRQARYKELEQLELRNDEITHTLFKELAGNFITPFDREDIHALSGGLDDIIDYIFTNAKFFVRFDIQEHDLACHQIAEEIEKAANLMSVVLSGLRQLKNSNTLHHKCTEIKAIVHGLDRTIDGCMAGLINNPPEPMMLLKLMDYYESYQDLLSKCKDAVNVVESTVLKYS